MRSAFYRDVIGDYAVLKVGAVLDFGNTYADDIGSDTIQASTWAATGLTVTGGSILGAVVTAFFSGAADGIFYWVDNTVVTVGGRTFKQSFRLVGATRAP